MRTLSILLHDLVRLTANGMLTIGVIMGLAACSTASAGGPTPDSPILVGGAVLPKSLATVFVSPTPSAAPITATSAPSLTPTPVPPTVIPSPTVILANFLGGQTTVPLDGTFSWQPTRDARIVISTARPGYHPTAIPITYNPLTPIAPNLPAGIAISGVAGGVAAGGVTIPAPGTPHACTSPIAAPFANVYSHNASISQALGCPTDGGYSLNLVIEHFQTGVMIWHDTHEIFALTTAPGQNTYWRIPDVWTDSLPASDPGLQPPSGLSQPVRGFGYAWRNAPQVRAALGWATEGEHAYGGFWQNFEHGLMLTDSGNDAYALIPLSGSGGVQFGALPR